MKTMRVLEPEGVYDTPEEVAAFDAFATRYENTNGLIRQYFPKGTDFRMVPLAEIREAERRLNSRPRKKLKFYMPAEKFYSLITKRRIALVS